MRPPAQKHRCAEPGEGCHPRPGSSETDQRRGPSRLGGWTGLHTRRVTKSSMERETSVGVKSTSSSERSTPRPGSPLGFVCREKRWSSTTSRGKGRFAEDGGHGVGKPSRWVWFPSLVSLSPSWRRPKTPSVLLAGQYLCCIFRVHRNFVFWNTHSPIP